MYCPNCEFEIKGEWRKECPICGGVLTEFSELEPSPKESKGDSNAGKVEGKDEESKEPEFFDLESALNADDEAVEDMVPEDSVPPPSEPEPGLGPMAEQNSVEGDLTSVLEKLDPDKELAAVAAEQSKLKSKYSSKLFLAISVIVVLVLTVVIVGGIFFLKLQQEPSPMVAQLKTKTEKEAEKVSSAIVKKEKKKAVAKKEAETGYAAQKVKKEISSQEPESDKKILPVAVKKDVKPVAKKETEPAAVKKEVQPSKVKVPVKSTVKKEKAPAELVKKIASTGMLYSIHTSSHKTKEVAVSEVNKLKKLGFGAYVQTATLRNGQVWHRVKVGDFSTRREAQKVQNELIKKDPESDSYIVQRKAKSKK
ncbi:MAG: SPOR domain-containing protein [Deltaproteobacteria bacterium]|nr:SPOR domain-containing protein [Deltaproteobacteria bacterium]